MQKNIYKNGFIFLVGMFLLALNYNLFFLPNHLVVGGTSGLSILFQKWFSWDPRIFLYVTSFLCILLSFFFLGIKKTSVSIVGSILYPFFVSFTEPLAKSILPHITFESPLLFILVSGILCGIANGMIYKIGFDTGGSDIIIRIVNKYFHISEGKSTMIVQGFIILLGGFAFGVTNMLYSILILLIYTSIMEKILIGISNSKMFFIHTKETKKVKDFILKELHTGVTILEGIGGYSKKKNKVLMCVVSNRDYYYFKEKILEIDSNAFFIIEDCYEVQGGVKGKNYPFI